MVDRWLSQCQSSAAETNTETQSSSFLQSSPLDSNTHEIESPAKEICTEETNPPSQLNGIGGNPLSQSLEEVKSEPLEGLGNNPPNSILPQTTFLNESMENATCPLQESTSLEKEDVFLKLTGHSSITRLFQIPESSKDNLLSESISPFLFSVLFLQLDHYAQCPHGCTVRPIHLLSHLH